MLSTVQKANDESQRARLLRAFAWVARGHRIVVRHGWVSMMASIVAISIAMGVVDRPSPAHSQEPGEVESKSKVDPDHVRKMRAGVALFKTKVRPLLVKHCVKCHGGQWTKGDFDLANRKALMASGMVDKAAADSHLLLLLRHEEEPHMPKDAPALKEAEIASIAQWIDLGAPYDKPLAAGASGGPMKVTPADRQFWSFRPLASQDPPALANADKSWARNVIDHFVAAKLREHDLHPNDIAAKRTLLRRAYFDLIGLPPTREQTAAFLEDDRPDAYERLIDELLESPHYGERWARHWMDVARFAESHGYEQDYNRPHAYHYRDFLIRALNDDLPYDQFVQWQLAGDELAADIPQAMMATGFLGAGVFPTQLTEAEFESARYDELDDMTTTTGVAFLGLSVGCARCHDHKFDPIPAKDYYRLAATFTSTIRSELDIEVDSAANESARKEHQAELTQLEARWAEHRQGPARERFRTWLQQKTPSSSQWTLLAGTMQSTAGGSWDRQADGSYLAKYPAPAKEVLTFEAATVGQVAAFRLEALIDPSFPRQGPGRADNGNFALGDIRIKHLPSEGSPVPLKLVKARATHQQNASSLSVAASIDGDAVSGWAVDAGGIGKSQAAVFDLKSPIKTKSGDRLEVTLVFNHPNGKHAMGRVRMSTSGVAELMPKVGEPTLSGEVLAAIEKLREASAIDFASQEAQVAFDAFLLVDPESAALKTRLQQLRSGGPKLRMAKVQVSSEGVPHMKHHADGRGYPHFYPETYFLQRGDVQQKKEPVNSGFLQVLVKPEYGVDQLRLSPPEGSTKSFRRATLAKWITDPVNGAGHLAARVMVNRVWQHHFGTGIVMSPNDFGFQGERPTHPELLDFLAADLISHQWKLKRLHKAIMTSATYMQASTDDVERRRIDPDNRWIWRRTPRRLEAEAIRDSMLAVANMLDTKMYGPGTLDINMKRRSVYFLIKRSQLISPLMLFDWPEHLVSIGRRATTTIAPQALMFMNSPQGRSYAQGFAGRLPQDPSDAVREAYWIAFSRAPKPVEASLGVAFIEEQAKRYKASNATDLARRDFCQALLGANEFIYVD